MTKKNKLSDTQKKILERLAAGERLARTRMGPWTGPFKFSGDKRGINASTIQKLRFLKLVEVSDKMTMYGLTEYCHIPEIKPWVNDPAYTEYLSYQLTKESLRRPRKG
jgi:hypothetical protein